MKDCIYTLHTMRPHTTTLLFVFLLFICIFGYCYSKNVGCFEGERIALLQFKESLTDKSNRLSSWTGLNCCKWEGVFCSPRSGHITKLDLHNTATFDVDNWYKGLPSNYSNNCLGGEINPSLINLTHLDFLDLSLNNFSGVQIPKFLGSFKNLRYLNLSSSGFVGNIPTQLGNLSSLEYLHLGVAPNQLFSNLDLTTYNLDWLANLSTLKSLDMSGIFIQYAENWVCTINKLVSLSSLNLADCSLNTTGHPVHVNLTTSLVSINLQGISFDSITLLGLSNLTRLEYLNLAYSYSSSISTLDIFEHLAASLKFLDISGSLFVGTLIPLCNLHNLVSTDLSENELHGLIPNCIGNLTSLTFLEASQNSFKGSIPNTINHLCRLQVLDLSFNELTGFIRVPSDCTSCSLQELYLDHNNFIGQLPKQLYKCLKLKYLVLSSNSLSGLIVDSLGNLSMLQRLHIDRNNFVGSIPQSLGKLSNLEELDISNNFFVNILSEFHFSKLSKLKYLSISRNLVVLDVSSNWTPPFQLDFIEMESIRVGPQFPHWLHTQTNVLYISMSNSSILDFIPGWFGNFFRNCHQIDLSKNHLSGELSLELHIEVYMKESIQYLSLSNNDLIGAIPKWLCNLKELVVLDLSTNMLSGEIPPCIEKLQNLKVLDLTNNNLCGRIPNSLGSLNQLLSLHLPRNKFEGELPSSLQNLRSLMILDLSENELMDVIPPWIGEKLWSIKFLILHTNKFYGGISFHLCQLQNLQLLNLANNNISGYIPRCFNNFTAMHSNDNSTFFDYGLFEGKEYEDEIYEDIKGLTLQYTKNLRYLRSIDLSRNNFVGTIPIQLTSLIGLENLNLSQNDLSGTIPKTIGNLSNIESLDLSRNMLTGHIPQSLSSLNFLSYLNLSFNNLYGRIPTGNQLQTLNDPSIYIGNEGLCGAPLLKDCPSDVPSFIGQPTETSSNDDHEFFMWFYAGMGPGFFVGFIGVLSILLFKRSWRHAYFKFLGMAYNKILYRC